ncbi:MAG: hypothetical protein M3273_06030, partial [Actinomycetota bacterium]|nr:hypothetical protein [Actinomycetota bacterium]
DPYDLGRTPILRSDEGRFFTAKLEGRLDGEAHVYRLLKRGPWRREPGPKAIPPPAEPKTEPGPKAIPPPAEPP